MKNWFSKLFEQTPEKGRNAIRLAVVLMVAAFIAVLVFTYVAVQTGTWQAYAVVAAFVGFFVLAGFTVKAARRDNDVNTAGILLIVNVCYIVLAMAAFMSGIGLALSIALVIVIVEIVFETLSGSSATRAGVSGLAFAVAIFFLDKFAPWSRPAIPTVQSAVPFIAALTVITIAILMIARLVTWRDQSLRKRLVATFIAVTLFTISMVGIVTNLVTTSQLDKVLGRNFNELALRMAHESSDAIVKSKIAMDGLALNKFVQDTVEEANQAGSSDLSILNDLDQEWRNAGDEGNPLITNVLNNELAGELLELQERLPQYAEIFVTDQYGAVIASTDRTSDYYQADEEWWQAAWNEGKGSVFVSQPVFDESAGIYAIDIALPIPAHNSSDNIGVLRSTININELTSVLTAGQFGETGQAVLLFPTGELLTRELGSELATLDPETLIRVDAMTELYEQFNYGGAESLVSKTPVLSTNDQNKDLIDNLGWQVIIHQEIKEAHAPVAAITRSIILIAIIVLIATSLLALWIGGQFSKPIENLTSVATEMANGNLTLQAAATGQDEFGTLARAFNTMTSQLRDLIGSLEQRVADRTKELESAQATMAKRATELQSVAEISTKASTAVTVNEMLQTVVDLTKSSYSLYHAHIYLMDDTKTKLVLATGAGEAGQIMVSEKRTIALDHPHSLVARAARTKQGAIANDVTKEPDFLPNPLLPDTKAEMAIPISIGDTVLGVLDVQADYINRFTDEDIAIKTTLAQQVAISLQNVQNFAQAQHQAERESMLNLIGQQIQSADSVEAVLQITARELSHALHSKDTRVILRDIESADTRQINS